MGGSTDKIMDGLLAEDSLAKQYSYLYSPSYKNMQVSKINTANTELDASGFPRIGTNIDTSKFLNKPAGLDWSLDGLGGSLLGAGQLGLGVMSYLENKKTASKQRKLMEQQYNINAVHEANLEADRAHSRHIREEAAKDSIFYKDPNKSAML
jgi:hypothetical protein